jgi:hypothetical protein
MIHVVVGQEENMAAEKKSSPVLILLAWAFVGLPLSWGVYNTVLNSMKLFQAQPATLQPPSAPTAK